jgi:hypothetical protein
MANDLMATSLAGSATLLALTALLALLGLVALLGVALSALAGSRATTTYCCGAACEIFN